MDDGTTGTPSVDVLLFSTPRLDAGFEDEAEGHPPIVVVSDGLGNDGRFRTSKLADVVVESAVGEHRSPGVKAPAAPQVAEAATGLLDKHHERRMIPWAAPEVDRRVDRSVSHEQRTMTSRVTRSQNIDDVTPGGSTPTIQTPRFGQHRYPRMLE
ncbi:MAG TPA: hypothetical protein VGJ86_05245, partial [Acidimicrobiales bacterium]